MSALSDLSAQLAAPIAGPEPAGADVTYEPAFERLRQSVDRLASVGTAVDHENVSGEGPFAGGEGADHAGVVEGAVEVLTEHAKDLRAAAYLVASLAHTDGAAGVAAGLGALAAMAQAHWAGLHPSRPRARRAAFEFLTARLPVTIGGWDAPGPDERESLEAAVAALADLQLLVASEMGDDAPALSGVRRALSERLRRVPSEPAPQEATPVESAPPEPAPSEPAPDSAPTASPESTPPPRPAPPAPTASAPLASPSGDPVRAVVQAAAALREATPGSPAALRLLRVVRWDALDAPPPATDGATRLEAPPARRREALAALAVSDPALFVEQAEGAFASPPFHFWLDLQRLTDTACAALGPLYADARAALRAEAAHLLGRLPDLLALQFRDGTPFADPATRAWASGLVSPTSGASETSETPDDDAFAHARDRVAAGDLTGALDSLSAPPDGRAGFVHRFQTADLCLIAGRADLALALLAALAETLQSRHLDAWEPGLAADVYAALARAARQSDRPEVAADAAARLAAVSPARAARESPA